VGVCRCGFCKVRVGLCVGVGNMYTCIYCISIFCTMFFVLFRLYIFVLIFFTSVRTTATE
jgi:hypothetical protein